MRLIGKQRLFARAAVAKDAVGNSDVDELPMAGRLDLADRRVRIELVCCLGLVMQGAFEHRDRALVELKAALLYGF